MSIQEIAVSNNQMKKLKKVSLEEWVMFEDDNGELVLDVSAYNASAIAEKHAPVEAIVGYDVLDLTAEYIVFN